MSIEVGGFIAPGFERVAEEFARGFDGEDERGAAFAAVLDGEPVADLWGGIADAGSGRPWEEDSLQLIFSGTKALVAVCLTLLVDRGLCSLEDRVCDHWPEFAVNGKDEITVAELVSHRGRLPAVRTPVPTDGMLDDTRMAALLAEQPPESDPRAAAAYHPLTFGWLAGELVRRISGRSVGRFFASEVAKPLGLDIWIGLPEQLEPRVTTLEYGPTWGSNKLIAPEVVRTDDLIAAVFTNPVPIPPDRILYNERAYRAAEIPGINAIGTARSLARLFGCLARGGELDGVRLCSSESIALARRELSRFEDPFTGLPHAYGLGFQLQTRRRRFGPPADAFGHAGAGGSVQAAWPQERVGVAYVMNRMRDDSFGDARVSALLAAFDDALTASGRLAGVTRRA